MRAGSEHHRAAAVTTAAAAAATVLVLLVGIWAASAGPDDPLRGQGPTPDRISTSPPAPSESPSVQPTEDAPERDGSTGWFTRIVALVIAAICLLLLAAVVSLLLAARPSLPRWRRRHPKEQAPDDPALDPVAAVSTEITADADEQALVLASGTPRNGIVACWHRFEVQAERAGVPRERWETSSEFTLRLLDLVEADASAVARLAGLYREARFSEHPLGEDDRAEALVALRRIHEDLRTLMSGGLR